MRLVEAIIWLARRRRPHAAHEDLPPLVLPPPAPTPPPLSPPPPPASRSFVGLPTHGRITSKFGRRLHPILKKHKLHAGVDIAAPVGTPVWATNTGVVRFVGRLGGYGNTVVIDHPGGSQTLYAHLSTIAVRRGQRVERGQQIGAVGRTGRVTGAHLHYEKRRGGKAVDPGIG